MIVIEKPRLWYNLDKYIRDWELELAKKDCKHENTYWVTGIWCSAEYCKDCNAILDMTLD